MKLYFTVSLKVKRKYNETERKVTARGIQMRILLGLGGVVG